jgi:hypothetical protein
MALQAVLGLQASSFRELRFLSAPLDPCPQVFLSRAQQMLQ